jgi:hypothetical protein
MRMGDARLLRERGGTTMARTTGHDPYGDPYNQRDRYGRQDYYGEPKTGAFGDDASDAQFAAYRPLSATAEEEDYNPEDMPIFLSGEEELSGDEDAPRRRFGSGGDRYFRPAMDLSKILKLGALTAAAAGIALAIASMENPLAMFSDAKASLNGLSASKPAETQLAAVEAPAAARPAISSPAPTAAPTVGTAPTRDEIALALRTAHQSPTDIQQPEVRQPEVRPPEAKPPEAKLPEVKQPEVKQPVAAAPAPRRMAPDEVATLLKRARGLLAVGDLAPARLLLERAADAQEASAALLLAQTYDPAVLGTQDMRSITPDPAMARNWYQKAARLGSADAQQRLAQMQN